jgi:hypothetical protein
MKKLVILLVVLSGLLAACTAAELAPSKIQPETPAAKTSILSGTVTSIVDLPLPTTSIFTKISTETNLDIPQTRITTENPPSPAPTESSYPLEIHETLTSGLTIDEYALVSAPTTEPLTYSAYRWTTGEMHIEHNPYRWDTFPDISHYGDTGLSLITTFQGQTLVAKEYYTSTATTLGAFGDVFVYLGDNLIDKIPVGNGSPIEALRGLWTYDQDWAVETAYVVSTYNPDTNEDTATLTGQVTINGEMLNDRDRLDETFGFQTMHGRPFYFFKQNGKINICYDDQPVILEYDAIPHYGCCSAGILNPNPAKNMVSFFAQRNDTWYYVEVGVFN